MGFWDIHCHLIPGVDDGAADEDEMWAMVTSAADGGTEGLVVTPHVDLEGEHLSPSRIKDFVERISGQMHQRALTVSLYPGAELRLNWGLRTMAVENAEALVDFSIAGSGRYLLVDLPLGLIPEALTETAFRLRLAGLIPVLAHPERHPGLASGGHLRDLLDAGFLLQLNGGSITGQHGDQVRRRAERLLREGLAVAVASDAHSAAVRGPDLREAYRRLTGLLGEREARLLMEENPQKMVSGDKIDASARLITGISAGRRWFFRRRRDSGQEGRG